MSIAKVVNQILIVLIAICVIITILIISRVELIMVGTGEIWIPNKFEQYQIAQSYGILWAFLSGMVAFVIYLIRERLFGDRKL